MVCSLTPSSSPEPTAAISLLYAPLMLIVTLGIPSALTTWMESLMSAWMPFGIITPKTLSLPSASTHKAATMVLSLPPDIPITALHSGPFSVK